MRTETEEDWEDCPLFAPQGASIPELPEQPGEQVSSAVAALSHLLYDEETPLEASELLRDVGNRYFKRGRRFVCESVNSFLRQYGRRRHEPDPFLLFFVNSRGYRHAIQKYNEAITAAADVPEALAPALLNRSMAEFQLENYGRALQDVEKSLNLMPGNVKAHYRYAMLNITMKGQRSCRAPLRLSFPHNVHVMFSDNVY